MKYIKEYNEFIDSKYVINEGVNWEMVMTAVQAASSLYNPQTINYQAAAAEAANVVEFNLVIGRSTSTNSKDIKDESKHHMYLDNKDILKELFKALFFCLSFVSYCLFASLPQEIQILVFWFFQESHQFKSVNIILHLLHVFIVV